MNKLSDLIEALQILLKYGNPEYPTSCAHDVLYVLVSPSEVSAEDIQRLSELGVESESEDNCFVSHRFDSA